MTRRKVSFLQGTVPAPYKLPAEDHRLNHAGLWVPSSALGGLRVRSGILPGPGNPGQVSVTAGGVNINPFQAVIQGTLSGSQGVYEVVADAQEFRAITAASATEFRRGYVIARVYDQLNAGAGPVKDDWDLEVVYGPNAATAGAATLPALPANSLVLREFAVSNTGAITLVGPAAVNAVARGGIPPVDTTDVVAGAYVGQYRDHPTLGLQRWNGTAWVQQTAATDSATPLTLTLAGGWANFGAGWDPLKAWRQGMTGFCSGMVKAVGAKAAGDYLLLTAGGLIPVGMRPPAAVPDLVTPAGGGVPTRFDVQPGGNINASTAALNDGQYITLNMHWPLA